MRVHTHARTHTHTYAYISILRWGESRFSFHSFNTIYFKIESFLHALHCLFLINQVASCTWVCPCISFWGMEKASQWKHFYKKLIWQWNQHYSWKEVPGSFSLCWKESLHFLQSFQLVLLCSNDTLTHMKCCSLRGIM